MSDPGQAHMHDNDVLVPFEGGGLLTINSPIFLHEPASRENLE